MGVGRAAKRRTVEILNARWRNESLRSPRLNTKVIERIEAKIAAGEIEANEVIALTMPRALPAIEEIAAQLKTVNQTIDNTVARCGSSL
jgi:hypothetical protein